MTTDRLKEIKARWPEEPWNTPESGARADIAWLIQEVERLRELQKEDEEIREAVNRSLNEHGLRR